MKLASQSYATVRTLFVGMMLYLPPLDAAELVRLDATGLAAEPLATWINHGMLGGVFSSEFDTPSVTTVAGVNGVTLDGNGDWYVGPIAPAAVTGNGSRTVIAWVYNPAIGAEETVFAWGRRNGPAGTNCSLNHGNHITYGAVTHWDASDLAWAGTQKSGVWTCIAYTFDQTTNVASVYTDGSLSSTKTVAPLDTWALAASGASLPFVVGAQNLVTGTRTTADSKPGSLTIARIVVHDRALGIAEIASIYNTDATVFGRTPVLAIHDFGASQSHLFAGEETTLSWSVAGASTLSISPAVAIFPGVSAVDVSPVVTTTYVLTAANADSAVSKAWTIHVDPGVPVAASQSLVVHQDTPTPITLGYADPNPPPSGPLWEIVTGPQHGVLLGAAPGLTYTPAAGYAGADSFTFRVSDGMNFSNTAMVSIAVNPPPADPTGIILSAPAISTNAVAGSFAAYLRAADPNVGESHTYELVLGEGDNDNGLFSIAGNQLIAQASFAGQAGSVITIRIRVTDSSGRSYDQGLQIPVVEAPVSVVINEIHYDAKHNARTEFVELFNPTPVAVALGGWQFTKGITYTFPPGAEIPAGGFLVVAQDSAAFLNQFGTAPSGQYSGRLAGDGELLELRTAANVIIDQVEYRAEFPWPVSAGGGGGSMELIHSSLDNNLGGSWRASVAQSVFSAFTYVTTASEGWRWRPGSTEASTAVSEWRMTAFAPDSTWSEAVRSPIGYGVVTNLPLNTNILGMRNSYRSFYARRQFSISQGEIPPALKLRYSMDDGILIWINGTLVAQHNMATVSPSPTTVASAIASEGLWYEVDIANADTFLVAGANTIAVQVFNRELNGDDVGFDLELKRPESSSDHQPTPGSRNSVFSATAAPQIRQVSHSPKQPSSSESVTITAKATDPQGVGSMHLHYQIVEAGNFIPAAFPRAVSQVLADPDGPRPVNPAFEDPANWTTVAMQDDGVDGDATAADGTFSVILPERDHRTLVRYRITATDLPGTSVRVPYADDESKNFAYFVYDGVPDYVAGAASVDPAGPGKVWPKSLLTSLPVYHWIIRNEDMMSLQAYEANQQFTNNGSDAELYARRAEEWEGAFVYDGVVYDHVRTRLRGGNSRYADYGGRFPRGKRHYKFRFNDGHLLQARDQIGRKYPTKWRALALNRMFGTSGGNGWGMPEEIGARLWKAFGVPAQDTHWIHFRVIDGAAESPDQYHGDFWGLTQAVEEYDGRYLDARGMTKGNLYKMSDWIWDAGRQRRYQSPDMVRDGSEFDNIRDNLHGGQTAEWLNQHVNYEKWYRYSAIAEAIRHYDMYPYTDDFRHSLKNLAWYFEPVGTDPARGVCTFLPYDWDASFGPNFNSGWEHANNALYGWNPSTQNGMSYVDKQEMKIAHRNVLREFRDLIWQPDQIIPLLDDRAEVIAEFSKADQDRWRNAPPSAGTANDDALDLKVADMKNFCFVGWAGSAGPTVGSGGRAAYLDTLADNADAALLPATPVITYAGSPGHPINGLAFQTSMFSDPQGVDTFGGMRWRIGQIEDPSAPAYDPADDFTLEYTPVWDSGTLETFASQIAIPVGALKPGRTYRVRVRMVDTSGRWSHWSAPYQFTTTLPTSLEDVRGHLMISEIMYNPAGPAWPGGNKEDFEFIELLNISSTLTLDLSEVSFTRGIIFQFAGSSITSLPPGARLLVVKNLAAFESRYGTSLPVAGVWDERNLSNGGERVILSFGAEAIHDFTYDDVAPWPAAADGSGRSLVLVDPGLAPDHAVAANWKASDTLFGSPGNRDSRFAVWLSKQGAPDPAAAAGPGMSFSLMYALGADLANNPAACLPEMSFTPGPENDFRLTLSFRTRDDGTDVSYAVETSTDLVSWQHGSPFTEPYGLPVDNGDGTHTVWVRLALARDLESRRFARLRATIADAGKSQP